MSEYREGQAEIPTVEGYVNRIRTILNKEGHFNFDKGVQSARAQIFGAEAGQEQSQQLFNEAVGQIRRVTEENKQRALPYKEKLESIYAPERSDEHIEEVTRRIQEFQTQFYKDHPEFDDYALYHVLAHSGRPYMPKFDTEDGELAKFIDSLNI